MAEHYKDLFPSILRLFLLCVGVIIVGISLSFSLGNLAAQICIIVIGSFSICFYCMHALKKSHALFKEAELQQSLLSAALTMHFKYYLIVRYNGVIVSASAHMREAFPSIMAGERPSLKAWFEKAAATSEPAEKILSALNQQVAYECPVSLKNPHGQPASFMLSVNPIPRPSGFSLLRLRPHG